MLCLHLIDMKLDIWIIYQYVSICNYTCMDIYLEHDYTHTSHHTYNSLQWHWPEVFPVRPQGTSNLSNRHSGAAEGNRGTSYHRHLVMENPKHILTKFMGEFWDYIWDMTPKNDPRFFLVWDIFGIIYIYTYIYIYGRLEPVVLCQLNITN